MSNPIVACETTDQNATSLKCENIDLIEATSYFKIVATTSQDDILSNIQNANIGQTTISPVQNFTLATQSISTQDSATDIFDIFCTITTTDYIPLEGSILISNGALHGQPWTRSSVYHKTSLSSPDQIVSVTCTFANKGATGLISRYDLQNQTEYKVTILSTDITLRHFSGPEMGTYFTEVPNIFSNPVELQIETSGPIITIKANGNRVINFSNTNYSSGNYSGVIIYRDQNNEDTTIDNFKGVMK